MKEIVERKRRKNTIIIMSLYVACYLPPNIYLTNIIHVHTYLQLAIQVPLTTLPSSKALTMP